MVTVHIVSLFPAVCKSYFEHSVLARAAEKMIVKVEYYNPLEKTEPLKRVDDRPYGGGPGMVIRAEPVLRCFDEIKKYPGKRKTLFFTPSGEQFTREIAKTYTTYDHLVLLCGHYEGMDERIVEATNAERISVGPFTLTGGELPALMVADAVVRELPGVLGNTLSLESNRIAGGKVYTRPESFVYEGKGYTVPEVLRSGHHGDIDKYRDNTRKSKEK